MYKNLIPKIFSSCYEHLFLQKDRSTAVAKYFQYGFNSICPKHRKHSISRIRDFFSPTTIFSNPVLRSFRRYKSFASIYPQSRCLVTDEPEKAFRIIIQNHHLEVKREEKNLIPHTNDIDANVNPWERVDESDSLKKRNRIRNEARQFVEPVQVPLYDLSHKKSAHHFTYVPILKTLRLMMENLDVQRLCASYPYENQTDGYFDIFDGEVLKKNDFFRTNPNALKLVLFQDSFETSFPIFTDKTKFDIIGIYMTLANLPPHIRNRKENMKLVLLCFEDFVLSYGWEQVLEKLVSDIKTLETRGISYNSESGREIQVKGSLIAVTGDNSGNHSIGGFQKNFSNLNYISRYCETKMSEFREQLRPRKLRTVESYNECIKEIKSPRKPVIGIKMNSPLNSLKYFHVCNPGLPPCCGHDLFGGFVKEDLSNSTSYFIKNAWFQQDQFDRALKTIDVTLKLPAHLPVLKKRYVRDYMGSIIQIKLLLMVYPLAIINEIKNYRNDVWRMILKLRQVCDLVSSPALTPHQVDNLGEIYKEYLNLRIKCFPESPLKPKHLFAQHYPTMIRKFGPLKHLWTAGFEEKHAIMRNLIKKCDDYGNVTDFVAEKHELEGSFVRDQYSDRIMMVGAVKYYPEYFEDQSDLAVQINCDKNFKYVCKKIQFRDVDYELGQYICVGIDESKNLIICKIHTILVNEELTNIFFVGKVSTIKYNYDTGLYEDSDSQISKKSHLQCFPHSRLISPYPLLVTNLNSSGTVYITHHTPFGMVY
ncbi:hypothetical protein QAD02_009850 [Eretmocerus hayati]|uniref:Uncharacterized protein n=1 Tax=Eretmocerus hayati TaxID=131215 RepID=A0ACC2NCV6_9HYME|nr:hypothetical protein QAD02_009850 [Eretmocerus hayati]